jgi:hypothetical protein
MIPGEPVQNTRPVAVENENSDPGGGLIGQHAPCGAPVPVPTNRSGSKTFCLRPVAPQSPSGFLHSYRNGGRSREAVAGGKQGWRPELFLHLIHPHFFSTRSKAWLCILKLYTMIRKYTR